NRSCEGPAMPVRMRGGSGPTSWAGYIGDRLARVSLTCGKDIRRGSINELRASTKHSENWPLCALGGAASSSEPVHPSQNAGVLGGRALRGARVLNRFSPPAAIARQRLRQTT